MFSASIFVPVDKSACISKPKRSRQIERDSFCVGCYDLANYRSAFIVWFLVVFTLARAT